MEALAAKNWAIDSEFLMPRMHWRGPDFIGPVAVSPPQVHTTAGISRRQYLPAIVLTASRGSSFCPRGKAQPSEEKRAIAV